jgi:hypothetical protein
MFQILEQLQGMEITNGESSRAINKSLSETLSKEDNQSALVVWNREVEGSLKNDSIGQAILTQIDPS